MDAISGAVAQKMQTHSRQVHMEDEDHTHQDIETGEDLGPEKQLTLTDPMLQGTICFSWEDGRFLKKVPYFIVPDGWENDPALLDRVVQGMNLTMPNMVLNFNPVKEPISRWNKEWDYWSPAADSVWEVDEDILPLVLPAGQSTGVKDVAEYMAKVVEDRTMDIVGGVAAACAQAKAWLRVTGHGMHDFVPVILSHAAQKDSVVFSTYCMEDFSTPTAAGVALDAKAFKEGKVKDRVPGGAMFCEALHNFSGNPKDHEHRPRVFVEDIHDVMRKFDDMKRQTVEPVLETYVTKGVKRRRVKKKQESCIEQLNAFFKSRAYLPPKDVTHLLVFQSRSTANMFNLLLETRVTQGNFLMAGSTEAVQMFDSAMKTGRPVFVMRGTGGAADKIHLIYEHMKYRKILDASSNGTNKDEEQGLETLDNKATWIKSSLRWLMGTKNESHAKVHPEHAAPKETSKKENTTDVATLNPRGLVALENKITNNLEEFQKEFDKIPDTGKLFRKLDLHSRMLWLNKLREKTEALKSELNDLMQKSQDELGERGDEEGKQLKERLEVMHSDADIIIYGDVAYDKIQQKINQEDANLEASVSEGTVVPDSPRIQSAVLHGNYRRASDEAEESKEEPTANKGVAKPKVEAPEDLYYHELKVGKAGMKYEKKLGCKYLGPDESHYGKIKQKVPGGWKAIRKLLDDVPEEWKLPDECDYECDRGKQDDDTHGPGREPCKQETCPQCNEVKIREREWLRDLAKADKDWAKQPPDMKQKYINFWMESHPLTHSDRDKLDPERLTVAKHARTIFANVYEPPIMDACVIINILEQDINIEDIMDDVTSAMSIDVLMNEVGEKTAMRRRLLQAHQMVHQLKHNARTQKIREHIINILVNVFTWLSVIAGTITFEANESISLSRVTNEPAQVLGITVTESEYGYFRVVNIALPLVTSFLIAVNAAFTPSSKYMALYHSQLYVESEIYKVRTRTGDYSPHAAAASAAAAAAETTEGEGMPKNDAKKDSKGVQAQVKNPRSLFAGRIDGVWTDLGASEVRQESLAKPKNLELLDINKTITVQQHPALFDEGDVLVHNKGAKRDTLQKLAYQVEDDGIKPLSSQDYVDLRMAPFDHIFAKRTKRLCMELQFYQFLIFVLTSASTLLGALAYMQWIPVALALGSLFGAIAAYKDLEGRLERANTATVSLRKLDVWWNGLSVIEKRIPANKTALVNTVESIIQVEAGSVMVNMNSSDSGGGSSSGGSAGADSADK